jgi:hypothetical protein
MTCHSDDVTVLVYAQFIGAELRNATVIGCRPVFEQIHAEVTVNATTGRVVGFSPYGPAEPIEFPDSAHTLSWVDRILADYANKRSAGDKNPVVGRFRTDAEIFPPNARYTYRSWFYLLSEFHKMTPGQFLDANVLQATTRTVFRDLWRMVASTSMFSPAGFPITGILTTIEARLVEQVVATRVLQIAFLILGLVHLSLCLLHDAANLPRDPSVLAYLSCILASNPHLDQLLEPTGVLTLAQIDDYLAHTCFKSAAHPDGTLMIKIRSKVSSPAH